MADTVKVRFTADHDHHPRPGVTIAYKAGMSLGVSSACAEEAIAAGHAVAAAKQKSTGGDSDHGA